MRQDDGKIFASPEAWAGALEWFFIKAHKFNHAAYAAWTFVNAI
jgi:hypothetical protein